MKTHKNRINQLREELRNAPNSKEADKIRSQLSGAKKAKKQVYCLY